MTPEEKLLALIQQDKKQPDKAAPAATPPAEPVAAVPVAAPKPVAAGAAREAPKPAEAQPVPEKKLKLATAPAPVPSPAAAAPVPAPQAAPAVPPAPPPTEPVSAPPPAPPPAPVKTVRVSPRAGGLQGLVLTNRVLAAVVLVLLAGVVYSIASIRSDVLQRVSGLKEGAGVQPAGVAVVSQESPPPVEVFLDRVAVRDVFQSSAEATTSTVTAAQGQVADLKLVGVSIDSASESESMAIIRNKADSKTYFVKTGEAVGETGYTLGRVLVDRAILKIRKQEIELR